MILDLSHPIEHGMVTYPGLPGPVISDHLTREASRSRYAEGTEFHIGRIEMVANTGTYLDTPFHRFPDGLDLADLPLDRMADLPGLCLGTTGDQVSVDVMEGANVAGHAVLFSTGWDRHWGTGRYGAEDHPALTAEAAEALVGAGAVLVGIDSVNIDDTRGGTRPVHATLLEAGIPVVEHLTGLGDLVGRSFRFYAVPAPVRGMGTFPVRAFAVLD